VSVLLFGSPGSILVVQQTTVTAEPGLGGQWSLLLDDEGVGLPEGNYIADAFFTGDLTSTDGRVGVP